MADYKKYIKSEFENSVGKNYKEVIEIASDFLILWSFYENYFYLSGIENLDLYKIEERIDTRFNEISGIDDIYIHFKNRYEGNYSKENSLFNGRNQLKRKFMNILIKKLEYTTNQEKQLFLSIILYRYRNNMLHGSKDYREWLDYKEEIIKLTDFMYKWLKSYK